jgi:hypothetical protein
MFFLCHHGMTECGQEGSAFATALDRSASDKQRAEA